MVREGCDARRGREGWAEENVTYTIRTVGPFLIPLRVGAGVGVGVDVGVGVGIGVGVGAEGGLSFTAGGGLVFMRGGDFFEREVDRLRGYV